MIISDVVFDGPTYVHISHDDPDDEQDMGEGIIFYYKDSKLVGIGLNYIITVTGHIKEISE